MYNFSEFPQFGVALPAMILIVVSSSICRVAMSRCDEILRFRSDGA